MWIAYSILAACCFTGLFLAFKYLELQGVPTLISLVWVCSTAALLFILQAVATKQSPKVSLWIAAVMIGTGVLSYVGNAFQFKATALAPNPGYAVALVSMQALLVTLASIFLFGSHFTLIKGVGVFLCVCGVMLLSLA